MLVSLNILKLYQNNFQITARLKHPESLTQKRSAGALFLTLPDTSGTTPVLLAPLQIIFRGSFKSDGVRVSTRLFGAIADRIPIYQMIKISIVKITRNFIWHRYFTYLALSLSYQNLKNKSVVVLSGTGIPPDQQEKLKICSWLFFESQGFNKWSI